jgi:integrase
MSDLTLSSKPTRDTGWKRDRWEKGVYSRYGGSCWGYYAAGTIHAAPTREAAIEDRDEARRRKRQGRPEPNRRIRIAELAEEVREAKRRRLRVGSFETFEYALDKVLLPELGALSVVSVGPDRIAKLCRDLVDRGLKPSTVRRYTSPLGAIFTLALRRGVIATNPMSLLSEDERPSGGGVRPDRHEWDIQEIAALLAAATARATSRTARYDYTLLVRILVATGLRVGEALALRWVDVDLLGGVIRVRHSLTRKGALGAPKTSAGVRDVPIEPGLVDALVMAKLDHAAEGDYVFSTTGKKPVSYHNFREQGFKPALAGAGLAGKGITIHDLRSAAISLYAARGLSMPEVADLMGQKDAHVSWKHYVRLFDRSDVNARVRAAQASLNDALDSNS